MMPGVYIHVPFCRSKCPYCDFYSLPRISEEALDAYTKAVEANLRRFAGQSCLFGRNGVFRRRHALCIGRPAAQSPA